MSGYQVSYKGHHYPNNHISYKSYKEQNPLVNQRREQEIGIKCRNCGLTNHTQKECYRPITSYGIILFYYDAYNKQRKYLMICRQHSIGFTQLIRGKYAINDLEYLQALINVMTNDEITMLQTHDYKLLWEAVWGEKWLDKLQNPQHTKHMLSAQEKFNKLKSGEFHNGITLNGLIQNKSHFYDEPEWGFPKGRSSCDTETPFQTAIREFTEETNIPIQAIQPANIGKQYIEECYKSYDNRCYRNIYFVYELCKSVICPSMRNNEVSVMQFFNAEDCKSKIRGYYQDKKDLIIELDRVISSYTYKKDAI